MDASIIGLSGLLTVLGIFIVLKFLPSKDVKQSLSSSITQSAYLVEDIVVIGRINLENSALRAQAETIEDFGGVEAYSQALVSLQARIDGMKTRRK